MSTSLVALYVTNPVPGSTIFIEVILSISALPKLIPPELLTAAAVSIS